MNREPSEIAAANSAPSGPSHRRHFCAIASSIAFHALVLAAITFLLPSFRPDSRPSYYVLAYFDSPGGSPAIPGRLRSSEVRLNTKTASFESMTSTRDVHRKSKIVSTPVDDSDLDEVNRDEDIASSRLSSSTDASAGWSDNKGSDSSDASSKDSLQASAGGNGQVIGEGNNGHGDSTGPGDGEAHAEYGADPAPPYPASARREGQQGEVVLRVLVGADGSVERVEMVQSSGFERLDDSALETVRGKWRFEPARRMGTKIESWVVVPIRFRLS